MATYNGTSGNDVYLGTADDDQIFGNGGDDVLDGGAGYDLIDGGAGNDTVSYASSLTPVFVRLLLVDGVTPPPDTFLLQNPDNLVGIENLTGSAYSDLLLGNAAANVISGGDGDDLIASKESFIYSPPGPLTFIDIKDTTFERDTLIGGSGNDSLVAGLGDNVDGGTGTDQIGLILSSSPVGITADLSGAFSGGTAILAGGVITGVEKVSLIVGSQFDDDITLGEAEQYLPPYIGNLPGFPDGFFSPLGSHRGLQGGDGNDILIGGSKSNILWAKSATTICRGSAATTISLAAPVSIMSLAVMATTSSYPGRSI